MLSNLAKLRLMSLNGRSRLHQFARTAAFGGSGGTSGTGGGSGAGGSHGSGNSGSGGPGRRFGWWMGMATLGSSLMAGSANAAKQPSKELTVDNVSDALWSLSGPILTNLGFSGCMGLAAGMALKKIGQFLAFIIGMAFLALQGLAYTGFITVNWTHVHSTVNNMLDLNKDGKVDEKDFKVVTGKGLAILAQGVPSVAGFLGGFMMGVRM